MAKQLQHTHDLSEIYLMVGGFRISHSGADGLVEFETASEIMEDTVSADGIVTVNKNNDQRLYMDIIVMENSRAHRILTDLKNQQIQENPITPLPVSMTDNNVGAEVTSEYATFKTRGIPNKGATANEVTMRLLLPYAADDYKYTG